MSLDSARRISANLRFTQYSILLHLIDICFIPLISQIQTCLRVFVGRAVVMTSPVFMRSSASHLAGPHDPLAKKTCKSRTHCRAGGMTQFAQKFATTASRLCCLEQPPLHIYISSCNKYYINIIFILFEPYILGLYCLYIIPCVVIFTNLE